MLNLVNRAKELQTQIVRWRRDLHAIPEIGMDLPKTSAYVCNVLREIGIEYKSNIAGTGIVALIHGENSGKVIALRADMDAVAVKEETGLPFAAVNGYMHACGHDCHTAMLLGAAKILNENREKLSGKVKLIFQPDEEGSTGAAAMIKAKAFDNPKVDAVLGLHIGQISKEVECGHIGVSYNKLMASSDKFNIKIMGRGCHGAMPHTGVDSIVVCAQVLMGIQTIISRELRPTLSAVVTVGRIQAGTAYNIIPDYVEFEGTIRTVEQSEREYIIKRLEEIIAGITKAMRADYEFNVKLGTPAVINNKQFTESFVKTAKNVIGEDKITFIKEPSMASEDMGCYLREVPGTFFLLGAFNNEKGINYPHHNSRFDIDENVLWKGTVLLAQGAVEWLDKNKE